MGCPQNARSRICVKNLPRYVSEDRLGELFSLKGEITDTKLMRTKDGKSRQFGFVGYRTEQEAGEAIKYFDKSFMDTCRISCEIAWKVGDPETSCPWSWYQMKHESSSKEEKLLMDSKHSIVATTKGEINKSKRTDGNDNPKFQEFLQVMQPRSKSKLWANDTPIVSSLELGKGVSNKKCYLYENQHGLIKDTLRQDALEVKAEDGSSREHSNKIFDSVATSSTKDEKEQILKTGHLIVFNLPYVTTEEELEEHFNRFGDITEVHLVVDRETKWSKGTAFVGYLLPECAARAFEKLNNSSFKGRLLYIRPAKEKNSF